MAQNGLTQLKPLERGLAVGLFVVVLGFAFYQTGCTPQPGGAIGPGADGTYLFCHWNVENLFDDQLDKRSGADKDYDAWFAQNPETLQAKLAHHCEALLKLNNGRGPDILALVEVENFRAAELLKKALNDRLPDANLHYQHVLMKEVKVGRHIAPAIITRLPVVADRTQLHGRAMRILEGHIVVDGKELIVLASHWTSRLDHGGGTKTPGGHAGDERRAEYADKIYGTVAAVFKNNPRADVLISGDFNDSPEDVSVAQHLHATADVQTVRNSTFPPRLLNLMADKDPNAGFGTHYYSRWYIFDQLVVSPGMVDSLNWSCDPASVQVINTLTRPGDKKNRPWRFGNERDTAPRGYSDHFPVTVRLKVNP